MTPQDQQKQELINTIENIRRTFIPDAFINERIADFILADRKRIVAPLIILRDGLKSCQHPGYEELNETLKNAGCDL